MGATGLRRGWRKGRCPHADEAKLLTDAAIRKAKTTDKTRKLFGGGSLAP